MIRPIHWEDSMTKLASFADSIKMHQSDWLLRNGLQADMFETKWSWVLTKENEARNLFDPAWWALIEGKTHKWARSLNSSQCFAVNLFAPCSKDPRLANSVLRRLAPELGIRPEDDVVVQFETVFPETGSWMGERRQKTQVDVVFQVSSGDRVKGLLLVEVKFTEASPGTCRGAKGTEQKGPNPDPSRCEDLSGLLEDSQRCYLVETEGRRYWEWMRTQSSPFELDAVATGQPCPFRQGLYQVMRNSVLASAAVSNSYCDWAHMALCIHPDNSSALVLSEAVYGTTNIPDAYAKLTGGSVLRLVDPASVVGVCVSLSPSLQEWGRWMCGRYQLPELSVDATDEESTDSLRAETTRPRDDDSPLLSDLARRFGAAPPKQKGLWRKLKASFKETFRRPATTLAAMEPGTPLSAATQQGFEPFCRVDRYTLAVKGDAEHAECALFWDGEFEALDMQMDEKGNEVSPQVALLTALYADALDQDNEIDESEALALLAFTKYLNLNILEVRQAKKLVLIGIIGQLVEDDHLTSDEASRLMWIRHALDIPPSDSEFVAQATFQVRLHGLLQRGDITENDVKRMVEMAEGLGLARDEVQATSVLLRDEIFREKLKHGQLPEVPSPSIKLKANERACFESPVVVHQQKTEVQTMHVYAGTRVKGGGLPIYLGGRAPIRTSREILQKIDSGHLVVTQKRVALMGTKLNYSITLDKLMGLELFSDAVQIHAEGRYGGRFYMIDAPKRLYWILEHLIGEQVP